MVNGHENGLIHMKWSHSFCTRSGEKHKNHNDIFCHRFFMGNCFHTVADASLNPVDDYSRWFDRIWAVKSQASPPSIIVKKEWLFCSFFNTLFDFYWILTPLKRQVRREMYQFPTEKFLSYFYFSIVIDKAAIISSNGSKALINILLFISTFTPL